MKQPFVCCVFAACLAALPVLSLAQDQAATPDTPDAQGAGDAHARPAAKAPPKKVVLKKTGQVVFKCGDTFTDQPVCPDQSKATRVKPIPWQSSRP